MSWTAEQIDRARGAIIGCATGDALGAGYEFGTAQVGPEGPRMIGGGLGNFEPGEWTDDTTMAWCILDVAATGADLRTEDALTAISRNFRGWYDTNPPDIGNQTRAVLAEAGPHPTAATLTETAEALHARTGHTAGNGSLMRTAPVALAHLHDPEALAIAARRVSALTHADRQAQDGCVLWSLAIRHAIVFGELDLDAGLRFLARESAETWAELIHAAETTDPSRFTPNGWVVTALQAAWSAVTGVPADDPEQHFADAVTAAIRIGDDTDTVAAIAGSLLGARWGVSAIPGTWRQMLHGYPGIREADLSALVDRTLQQ